MTLPLVDIARVLSRLADHEPIGFAIRNAEGCVTAANTSFLSMCGRAEREVAARTLSWHALVPGDVGNDGRGSVAHSHDLELVAMDGKRVPVLVVNAPFEDGDGAILSICVDLRGAREAWRTREVSAAKARFLAAMRHELRTPLNAIAGFVQLLDEEVMGPTTPKQREALGRIRAAQRDMLQAVDTLLASADSEAGRTEFILEDVHLATAIDVATAAISSQLHAKKLTLVVDSPPPDMRVHTDRAKLARIFQQLLSNAVKFSPAGGRIAIDVATRQDVPTLVFVRVTDEGAGIPRDREDAIFEPFVQGDEGLRRTSVGIGLGLSISRDLARAMGGDLRVRSTEGVGSTFTLALRRA